MKKIGILILAYVIFIPFFARSQNEGVVPSSNLPMTEKQTSHAVAPPKTDLISTQESSGGAPASIEAPVINEGMYLEPEWIDGKVILTNQNILDSTPLRYDIYHQQVQFVRNGDTIAFAKPEEVASIIMGGRKLIYIDYSEEGKVGKGYFEVLSYGDTRLLLHRIVKYHEQRDPQSNLKEDVFIRENHYYIQKPGEMPTPVEFNRTSVLNAFSDKEAQVQEYIENNKFKMKTLNELKNVLAYYNTLR
jgi:hypothetical protein